MARYIFYVRVSKQGSQFNGIDAQLAGLDQFVANHGGEHIATYVEEMSGAKDNRPELAKALAQCKRDDATLLIYRLDRLSRKVSFVARLMDAGVRFKVATMPDADEFAIHIYAALGQKERAMISQRTKEALKVVKERGIVLGRAKQNKEYAYQCDQKIIPLIKQYKAESIDQTGIANRLNDEGYKTSRGLAWSRVKVCKFMQKYANLI